MSGNQSVADDWVRTRTGCFLALRLLNHPYEAELSHLGTREGLLRCLRQLAQSAAYAGGASRLVLWSVLSRLQGAAGAPISPGEPARPNPASGRLRIGADPPVICLYLGRSASTAYARFADVPGTFAMLSSGTRDAVFI